MRAIACASVIAVWVFSTPLSGSAQQATVPAAESETIIVRLSNFTLNPEHLRLKLGCRFGSTS